MSWRDVEVLGMAEGAEESQMVGPTRNESNCTHDMHDIDDIDVMV